MSENRDHRYDTDGVFTFARRGSIQYLECRALKECAGITHAFCTRWGGTSEGRLADLNFGIHVGDSEEHLTGNRQRLRSAFGLPGDNPVTVAQVHGDRIMVIDETFRTEAALGPLEYDGIITAGRGIAVGIKTADCVPLLFADPVRGVVGAIHAGWRGTALGIAAKAVDIFIWSFSSAPEDILVAIGPAIGRCCYEVDAPVFHAFDNTDTQRNALAPGKGEGKWMLDLIAANRLQVQEAGIPPKNIFAADLCTSCRRDTFFSHRGEGGNTGRQMSFIMLR